MKNEFNLENVDDFQLILISDDPLEYAIRFNKFGLSLKEMESLLNEKESMNYKLERSFETIRELTEKINFFNEEKHK